MAINYRTSLLGENPYSTSSFYIMMLHMQEMWGSFTAPGGVGGLVEPLEKLMLDVGIEVIKGDAVTRLECSDGEVRTVVLQSGRKISCSHSISDISPHELYGRLLPDECSAKSRELLGDIKYSPSVFSYHFTTRQCYSDLPSMMVVFPGDFRKFCSQIYDEGLMPDELLLGVYRASFYDSSLSPEGGDHFSVYLSVPNLQSDIRWEEVSAQLVEDIVARLEEYLLPNLSANLLEGFHRTPLDMQSECSLPYGAGFGRQVTKVDLGKEFFPNEDPDLSNLYLVGHNTMPGPGLNAVLMSAQFAAAKIPAPA
jgi:phytoene dehydrogenase-like protein